MSCCSKWETVGCSAVMSWKLITHHELELGVIIGKRELSKK